MTYREFIYNQGAEFLHSIGANPATLKAYNQRLFYEFEDEVCRLIGANPLDEIDESPLFVSQFQIPMYKSIYRRVFISLKIFKNEVYKYHTNSKNYHNIEVSEA